LIGINEHARISWKDAASFEKNNKSFKGLAQIFQKAKNAKTRMAMNKVL